MYFTALKDLRKLSEFVDLALERFLSHTISNQSGQVKVLSSFKALTALFLSNFCI
jgi:hypothetical protein